MVLLQRGCYTIDILSMHVLCFIYTSTHVHQRWCPHCFFTATESSKLSGSSLFDGGKNKVAGWISLCHLTK